MRKECASVQEARRFLDHLRSKTSIAERALRRILKEQPPNHFANAMGVANLVVLRRDTERTL